ncbi:MAG: zinc ABC transporter substrate-binding protein [Chlamydiia bacterium]|nr:zinc ABC transporter substrate-binding protein [Chlamydiia bacterium]
MKVIPKLLLSFFLLGCSSQSPSGADAKSGRLNILSTTAMIHDIVSEIGGEDVDTHCLIVGNLDPHSYELVKGDDEKFSRADLIFYNGLGLEHGASLLKQLKSQPSAIGLGDRLFAEDPKAFLVIEDQLDPHFWMDVSLFSRIIDPIVEALQEKDPNHAAFYKERGEILREKMIQTDQRLFEKVQTIPEEKRYLVTSHDAFFYFTRRYLAQGEETDWEERFMAPEGLAPDGQMSLLDIEETVNFLCAHEVPVVFPETNINRDALKKIVSICKEKGRPVRIAQVPLYGDAMGTKTYLEMIEHNANVLKEQLIKE